jgi:hypothetical protein
LSEGKILRSIHLDSVADALAIDPGEHRFYAGCRDGKIYIKALNVESNPTIGILFDHRLLFLLFFLSSLVFHWNLRSNVLHLVILCSGACVF